MRIISGSKVLLTMLKKQFLIFIILIMHLLLLVDDSNNENDDFLDHIFGKQQKVQQNEVELYLKASRATRNQDVLLWWKVCINNKLLILF